MIKTAVILDCKTPDICLGSSKSIETQGGENIEKKMNEGTPVQAFVVRLDRVVDSEQQLKDREKERKAKRNRHLFYACCGIMSVISFGGGLCSWKSFKPHSRNLLKDERSYICFSQSNLSGLACQGQTLTAIKELEIYHAKEIIKLLAMNDTITTNSEDENKSSNSEDAKKKAKNFFQSCLLECQRQTIPKNNSANNSDNKPAQNPDSDFIKNVPFFNQMLDELTRFSSVQEKLEYLHNYLGFSPIFHWDVGPDLQDSNSNAIKISIQQSKFTPEEIPALTRKLTSLFGTLFSNHIDEDNKDRQLDSLVEMQMSLLTGMDDVSDSANPFAPYSPMTLAQLQKQVDMINWPNFFKNALKRLDPVQVEKVTANTKVMVLKLSQLLKFDVTIKKVRTEYSEHIFNALLDKFLVWQVMIPMIQPMKSEEDCSYNCEKKAVRHFEFAVTALLLEKSPSFSPPGGWPAIFSTVREMTENIRAELIQMLGKSPWHEGIGDNPIGSGQIARALVEKAKATRFKIGYPEFIDDPQQLNEHYAVYGNMNKSDYFGNLQKILVAKRVKNSELFGKPVDKSRWLTGEANGGLTVVSANARHNFQFNEIVIPVGILHPPIFHIDSPLAENYGALGMIIGHELFHGFEFEGLNYDKNGNFQNATVQISQKFSDCLVRQYSSFQYDNGTILNGTLTLMENVADNGGIIVAMRALMHLLERRRTNFAANGQVKDFHHRKLKNLQMFFASFATAWCDDETNSIIASADAHSPGKFRVLGALSNIPVFSEAFSCSQQQPLPIECPIL